jgi:hypothetical protein
MAVFLLHIISVDDEIDDYFTAHVLKDFIYALMTLKKSNALWVFVLFVGHQLAVPILILLFGIGSPRLGECRILVMRLGLWDVVCSLMEAISFVLQSEYQFGPLALAASWI